MFRIISITILTCVASLMIGQSLTIDGYVYESGNRGFLNVVNVVVQDADGTVLNSGFSDLSGHFEIEVPVGESYTIVANKDMFEEATTTASGVGKVAGDKIFLKMEMKRAPGYIFEISLAEQRDHDSIVVDAIKGARIEVYNNTTKEAVLELEDHPDPNFEVALLKGNHYTILVRKDHYMTKRMEAFVDVKGCILCFEGIGSVGPGVTDNLSEGNEMGVLLANVELDKIYEGKTLPINDISYEYGKANLDKREQDGLLALALLMQDNPDLTVEIGAHTDSRGKEAANFELSRKRAQNVVDFLVLEGVDRKRLISKGYGESQLVNDCTSFVDCTETQHRANRRTELKILGIAAIKAPKKTLAQIKQMEQAELMLADIQFGGQVKVPEDVIEETATPAVEEMTATPESPAIETEVPEDTAIEDKMTMDTKATEVVAEQVEKATEVIAEQVEKVIPAEEVLPTDNAEAIQETLDQKIEEVLQNKVDADTGAEPIPMTEAAETETMKIAQAEAAKAMVSMPVISEDGLMSGSEVTEVDGQDPLALAAQNGMATEMTSFQVAIRESETAIAKDDPLFKSHSLLNEIKTANGYVYTIGFFDNEQDALQFYNTVKLAYENASVVKLVGNKIMLDYIQAKD